MRIWISLGVMAWLCGSLGSAAAIPLVTAPCGARATCKRAAPQRRERALLDQLEALRLRATHELVASRKLYEATLSNARRAWALAKPAGSWKPPEGMRASLATASVGANAPARARASSTSIPSVPPDEFYLQTTVDYPPRWVAARRAVNVRWTLFDQRHLPDAWSPLDASEHAIYSDLGHQQPITARRTRYTQRVSGLGLLPGRYFIAAEIVVRGIQPRLAIISLGTFLVRQPPAPGVRVLLPHYSGWYYRHAAIKLGRSKALLRGRTIQLSTSVERRGFQVGPKAAPVYLEVVAESGFRQVALYRAIHRLRRPRERLRLRFDHGLPSGPYQLRLTAYSVAKTQRHGSRGVYDYQRLPLTVTSTGRAVGAPPPQHARKPLQRQIDQRLTSYLRQQSAVSFYRQRLQLLQQAWQAALANLAAQSRPTTSPTRAPRGP